MSVVRGKSRPKPVRVLGATASVQNVRMGRDRKRPQDVEYVLPDPQLRAYGHGVGTLKLEGVLQGYLACALGELVFPRREPSPWFVVVWTNGTKEPAFEDYGPLWYTVRELDAGIFDHHGPSVWRERRGLSGRKVHYLQWGPPTVFEFSWLPEDEAAAKWQELGLADSDF
jgi:hypothetical protein